MVYVWVYNGICEVMACMWDQVLIMAYTASYIWCECVCDVKLCVCLDVFEAGDALQGEGAKLPIPADDGEGGESGRGLHRVGLILRLIP